MNNLPTEVLLTIFEWGMDYHDLKRLVMVCHRFRNILETRGLSSRIDRVLFRSPPEHEPTTRLRIRRIHPLFWKLKYDCTENIEDIELSKPHPMWLTVPEVKMKRNRLIDLPAALENAIDPAVSSAEVITRDYACFKLGIRQNEHTGMKTDGYGPSGAVTVLDVMAAFAYQLRERRLKAGEPLALWKLIYTWDGSWYDAFNWARKADSFTIYMGIYRDLATKVGGRSIGEFVSTGAIPKSIVDRACSGVPYPRQRFGWDPPFETSPTSSVKELDEYVPQEYVPHPYVPPEYVPRPYVPRLTTTTPRGAPEPSVSHNPAMRMVRNARATVTSVFKSSSHREPKDKKQQCVLS